MCSALEAKGIHPLRLQVERSLLRAHLCPLGLFLEWLGRTCHAIGAQLMALLLICEANRRVSSTWSLIMISEPLLRRRPAPGLVAGS